MTTEAFVPHIAPEIWQRHPEYRAMSVVVRDFQQTAFDIVASPSLQPPAWMAEHLEAWRSAFRAFGANPKKTPCSVEALWKRLQKGGELPAIDPVVDLYNVLSIQFGACFGGEDLDRYVGLPRLRMARGDEPFDTVRDGVSVIEQAEPCEIVWRDDVGVTCRRWNWRQCKRTALGGESRNLWFIIDRLPPMPIAELERAGQDLVAGLGRLSPDMTYSMTMVQPA